MTPRIQSIKKEIPLIHEVARKRLHSGEDARRIVQGISDSIDALLRRLFSDDLMQAGRNLAIIAVGGYGRREMCPHSDLDVLFLYDDFDAVEDIIQKMVRDLWDAGFDVGHSVRSIKDCIKFMKDDHVTAATLLEARFLAGSEHLMRLFQEKVLSRYCKSHTEKFVNAKLDCLTHSIEGEGRTIYVTQPHLKEGAGCLRDIQHILWIERLRRNVKDLEDIASHGGFSFEEVRKLEKAYSFYLRLRCELHFVTKLKQDILEHESQVAIAKNLGYITSDDHEEIQEGLGAMMREYYLHARNVRRFSRFYLESKSRGQRFLDKLRHRLFSTKRIDDMSVVDGYLYMGDEPNLESEELANRVFEIFSIAQVKAVDLSHSTRDWIRRRLAETPEDFSRLAVANQSFLWILQRGRNAGKILTRMHEVGALSKILPEFEGLNGLVTFDGHHQFSVDEHTLRTLRELDRIETREDYPEPEFQEVLRRIDDRLPLRVALLLHDIGKSQEGAHDAKGTEAAVVICERLGFNEEMIEVVEFLVYRHLVMFQYSQRINLSDPETISSFAKLVGNAANLDMLYLLTYIDIKSVGGGTWTSWKGAQLSELYNATRAYFEKGELVQRDLREILIASDVAPELIDKIVEHCRLMHAPGYERETIPERMAAHVELVEEFLKAEVTQIHFEDVLGITQLTFCKRDQVHLFCDLTGLLLSEGLNILGARIHSREDGVVLDIFNVSPADDLRIPMSQRVENLRKKLKRIHEDGISVEEILKEGQRRYTRGQYRKPLLPPKVKIINDVSEEYSVIEVHSGDRPGLLHDLSIIFDRYGLNIQMARVSTMMDRARDVFHVSEAKGGKIINLLRLRELEDSLKEAARWKTNQLESGTTISF